MNTSDNRPEHLGWVETALRSEHADLQNLRVLAQSHYGPEQHLAFVEVHGIDDDRERRRRIRAQAGEFLQQLGYRVEIEHGRDVYDVIPVRPETAHEALQMLVYLRVACGEFGSEE